jgi:FkbM family methyltransferase
MTFISYAQNYEDVMLWRALKHVEKGFYIDVGANDPVIDSVTKAFYDRGWRGINIEPLKSHFEDLSLARERDINLQVAVGEQHGQIELWECEIRGWATASSEVIAKYESQGRVGVYHKVPVLPLKDICSQYSEKEIHFLKIDVEGFEENVIRGMDFLVYRPWIVLVEATKPNSIEENHFLWEPILKNNGYLFAYGDGLNRFYLALEKHELLEKLRYPPNVFDGFILAQHHELEVKAEQAEAKAEQAEAKAEQAEAKAEQAEAKAEQAEAKAGQYLVQLQVTYNSSSWRITKPLRICKAALRFFIRKILRLAIRNGKALARQFPLIKRAALLLLRRSPLLMQLITRLSDGSITAGLVQRKTILHFAELRSVRIMLALSQLPAHSNEGPVTFLEVNDDAH